MIGMRHFSKICSNGAEIAAPFAPVEQHKIKPILKNLLQLLQCGAGKIVTQNRFDKQYAT